MKPHILVAYATKYGGTEGIAKHIAEALQETGLATELLPVKQVEDPTSYRAVILGSAIYMGRWRREMGRFLQRHEAELASLPLWIFSSGPTDEGDPEELLEGWKMPAGHEELIERIGPEAIDVFHGRLEPELLNPLERWVIRNVKAPTGDYRQWDDIESWAKDVAKQLQQLEALPET